MPATDLDVAQAAQEPSAPSALHNGLPSGVVEARGLARHSGASCRARGLRTKQRRQQPILQLG